MNDHDSSPEKISISYDDLKERPVVRVKSQTTIGPQGAGTAVLSPGERRKNTAVIFSLLGVILVLTVFVVLSVVLNNEIGLPGDEIKVENSMPGSGIVRQQLKLSSPFLAGSFSEADKETGWIGSCCVLSADKSYIYLVTNAHCLGLDELAQYDEVGSPEVAGFFLGIEFPSGEKRLVEAFAHHKGPIDLALLKVSAKELIEGRDYISLPHASEIELMPGDEVVAVGNPLEYRLRGTHTFGRISALRDRYPDWLRETGDVFASIIQTDAAINGGNSGGPLFINEGDKYRWIGVNSGSFKRADGIAYAIHVNEVLPMEQFSQWHTCDVAGAIKALREHYNVQATDVSGNQ